MFNRLTKSLTSFAKIIKKYRKNRLSFAANVVLPHCLITYQPRAKNTVKTKIIKKLFGSYKDFLYLCSRNKDKTITISREWCCPTIRQEAIRLSESRVENFRARFKSSYSHKIKTKINPNNNNNLKYTADTDTGTADTAAC